jgi:hypothetical protein
VYRRPQTKVSLDEAASSQTYFDFCSFSLNLGAATWLNPISQKSSRRMSNSLLPPILNPSSLYSEEAKRDATRIRIYNNVLQQIYNKVKAVSRVPGNEKSLWYLVPEFIPGTPRFEVGDCILYLVWNLRNVGYTVAYTHPNLMFISWRNHDEKYKERQSPWAQVLGAAREQVLTTAAIDGPAPITLKPSHHRPATAPASATGGPSVTTSFSQPAYVPENKRKSVLKKTNEYKPLTTLNVATSISTPGPAATGPQQGGITGTLTSRHVSFV